MSRFMTLLITLKDIIAKNIQIDNNKCEYILFKIDIYFSDYF